MNPIENYIIAKQIKTTRFDRLLKRTPNINTTRTLASPLPAIKDGEEKILKPSIWLAFVSVFVMLPLIGLLFITLGSLIFKPISLVDLMIALFAGFILYIAAKHSVFNKNYFYEMNLNGESLTVGGKTYPWKDVTETAIYEKQEGRNTRSYLIIFKNDHSFTELSLNCFMMSNSKIARYVEYYKHKASAA